LVCRCLMLGRGPRAHRDRKYPSYRPFHNADVGLLSTGVHNLRGADVCPPFARSKHFSERL
jgi:hypothetical protein